MTTEQAILKSLTLILISSRVIYYSTDSVCSSTGTFVKNADATWDVTGTSGIPEGWTVETAIA